MIKRDPEYYTTGFDGKDPGKAPFYLRSLVFDGEEGDFNMDLINRFNEFLAREGLSFDFRLLDEGTDASNLPKKIVIINASHDDLPTSYETRRIFEERCKAKGASILVVVVNTSEELEKELSSDIEKTLIMSQCVDKKVYNVEKVEELSKKGAVIVPGAITAPGSIFSDKGSTYRLLSDEGKDWSRVARYEQVPVIDKKVEEVVDDIFTAIDKLQREIDQTTFFIKPHEGGGGLGGFRIAKTEKGYIIPDLSKVTGDNSAIHPTFIDFDVNNEKKLKELLWIYRLFEQDEKTAANYLKVKLPMTGKDDKKDMEVLKEYIESSEEKRHKKLAAMVMKDDEAREKLVKAIKAFEKKFDRRYEPLVNEHIDFGLWGLRAHYRLSKRGPVLETMYHRVFQLGFTEEGLGYLGADNISNKQTGDLEIIRLGPINKIMIDSIGGEKILFATLHKGAEALIELIKLLPEDEKRRVPIRVQLDLAAVSQRIGEGNADTARGLCLASRWTEFVRNGAEWLDDSFAYYAWKKGNK